MSIRPISIILLASCLALGAGTAAAQEQARQPEQIQRVPAQRIQQDTPPTLTRRALDLLNEDEAEDQTPPPRGREPISGYGLACTNIREVSVLEVVIRLTCGETDRNGNRTYSFDVAGYDDAGPRAQARRWYASEFLQTVYHVQDTPGAALHLRVGEQRAYEPYIQTFTIEYED